MSNIQKLLKMNYSNIKLAKRQAILTIILFIAMSTINPIVLNMLINVIVLKMSYEVIIYEINYEVNNLTRSLVFKKEEYIKSKYLSLFINLVLGSILLTICYFILYKYSPARVILPQYSSMLWSGILASVFGICVLIPLIFKIGAKKVRFIGILIITVTMFLPMGILMSEWMIANVVVTGFERHIIAILRTIGLPMIGLILSTGIIMVSYKASLNIYENRYI